MMQGYHKRIVDRYFEQRLKAAGALLIEGPKWCGKTTTAKNLSSSALYLQEPDDFDSNMYYAENRPSKLLEGEKPRLIDEWQVAPKIWNAVRFSVDKEKKRGLYILTGSSVPNLSESDRGLLHSGTGRIARARMRTMSLFEMGVSNGSISLRELFDGKTDFETDSDMTLERLAEIICIGGWPSNLDLEIQDGIRTSMDYVESIVNSDISRVDGIRRNPYVTRQILSSLSRNICTLAELPVILKDIGNGSSRKTVSGYINALRKIFVVEDIPAWSPALLSKARLSASVKRNLTDPSIATAVLNIGPEKLVSDKPVFGSFFESMCIRDLRVYSQVSEAEVFHYHDTSDLEVDAIIEMPDGRWGAIEIKLHSGIEEGAKNLLRLKKKTKLVSEIEPSFMAVIVGTGSYQKRDDGVLVIPIGCLRD